MRKLALLLSLPLLAQQINLDTQTKGRNIHWDNANRRFVIGWDGSFGGVIGKRLDVKDAGPNWATTSSIHNSLRVSVNDYPLNRQHAMNTNGMVEAVVGAIRIPSTAASVGAHSTGVAGYASTASTTVGAVGVYAGAFSAANNTNTFGFNAVINNCVAQYCDPADVFTGTNHWGLELDFNLHKLADLSAPNSNVRGISLIGDSAIQPLGLLNAIDIDKVGITQGIPWKKGLYFNAGAANNPIYLDNGASTTTEGIWLGTDAVSGASGSQYIGFHSRTSGGTLKSSTLRSDPDGNLAIKPGVSSLTAIQNGAGTSLLLATDTSVILTVPLRLSAASTPASAGATCSTGDLRWDSGFIYVCVGTDTWKRSALTTW